MRAAGGTVTVVGRSMWPLLRPGDRVAVRPLSDLPPLGAVLVFTVADELVVHRLVRIESRGDRTKLVTKGDLSARCDAPIEPDRVLGQAVRIETRWSSISLDHRVWRVAGRLFATWAPHVATFLRRKKRSRNEA